ncbi:MAG: class I SAM-dependent methyltransferase [Bacillota bacterium]
MVKIGFKIAPRAVEICHYFLKKVVIQGDKVVDATAGNGYDTLLLAKLVGDSGKVYSFDIQEKAIEETRRRLNELGLLHRVELICSDHENLKKYVKQPIKAIVFNLGYLPGGNKEIVTRGDSTLKALEDSLDMLFPGGVICLVVYWGHEGGPEEKEMIESFISQLSPLQWDVINISFSNKIKAPVVIAVQKRSGEDY